jgi:glucosyl-3-phosphoglycerate phosphatase
MLHTEHLFGGSGARVRSRTVLLIRHGESTFNAAYREPGVAPLHIDARLTETGLAQVAKARETLRNTPVDLVVVSPLTRALQTALGIFADHPSRPTLLVEALHREHGYSSCDVGRAPALLAAEYPSLRFDHLPETLWEDDAHCPEPDERGIRVEPIEACHARVERFRAWLDARPERAMAVVGHGTFFHHLTGGRWLANCEVVAFESVAADHA